MNLNSYRYFLETAERLSITRAAANLNLSQQALSLQIQGLEEYYGVVLFERRPVMRLTAEGEALRETAKRILREDEELKNRFSLVSTSHYGTLQVGISAVRASASFSKVLPAFRKKWPNIKVMLVSEDTDSMIARLKNNELDLVLAPVDDAGELRRLKKRFTCRFLAREQTYLVCSDALLEGYFGKKAPEVKEAAGEGTDLTAFSGLPYLLMRPGSHLRRISDSCFRRAGFFPEVLAEAETMDLIESLYPGNYGAFLCRGSRVPQLKKEHKDLNAFPIRQEEAYVDVPLYLLYIDRDPRPFHMYDFIDAMIGAWKNMDL